MGKIKLGLAGLALGIVSLVSTAATAATSVAWTSPANGSSYPAGTLVDLHGNANATGGSGTGLDLVLVLDSSGSMGSNATSGGVTKTRREWQADAAIALVNNLPAGTTSVSVVEFDSGSSTVRTLSPLTTDLAAVIAAINSVNASGGTNIANGITRGTAEVTGPLHTPGRAQHMVVFSDGNSSSPVAATTAALAAGVDAVHAIAMPGSNLATMQSIANAPGNPGTFFDASGDLQALIDLFNGTGGTLVGISHVDVTLADGTVLNNVPVDAFGNFVIPDVAIALGSNTFTANAYGTDGTSASATLTLNGTGQDVPAPGALALLGLGLAGLGIARRRRKA